MTKRIDSGYLNSLPSLAATAPRIIKINAAMLTTKAAGTTSRTPMPKVKMLNTTATALKINSVNWKFIDSVA